MKIYNIYDEYINYNTYNIYISLKILKKDLNSIFLKSLISFFIRCKIKTFKILDFGNYFYSNKLKRLFYFKVFCKKKNIKKIFKLFKLKNNIIYNYIIIKKNLNKFILNFDNFKDILNKNLKIIPSILLNIKFKTHNIYSNIIKNLKKINLISVDFLNYIKKINFLYD